MKSVIFEMTENEFRRKFGNELGKVMMKKNISQLGLARAIGVNKMTVANWLEGKTSIKLYHAYLISKTLEIPIEAIIGEEFIDWRVEINKKLDRILEMQGAKNNAKEIKT